MRSPAWSELDGLKKRILEVLSKSEDPKTQETLRLELHVRTQRLQAALRELEHDGAASRTAAGWCLVREALDEPLAPL